MTSVKLGAEDEHGDEHAPNTECHPQAPGQLIQEIANDQRECELNPSASVHRAAQLLRHGKAGPQRQPEQHEPDTQRLQYRCRVIRIAPAPRREADGGQCRRQNEQMREGKRRKGRHPEHLTGHDALDVEAKDQEHERQRQPPDGRDTARTLPLQLRERSRAQRRRQASE